MKRHWPPIHRQRKLPIKDRIQAALVAEQAIQCGFCTPGIAMAAAALLAHNADPSDAEIRAAIPNLCRCGVYPRLVRAVQSAGKALRGVESLNRETQEQGA